MPKKAIIIGAGPAGLTAAYELLNAGIIPIIFEADSYIGGISKTINYKGNRIDIGGHRFFSKSDEIMNWWLNILPLENNELIPEKTDKIMLLRSRLSRIFFLRKFFDYPVSLSWNTVSNLGLKRILKIISSYIKSRILPKKEKSLEDFFINRFGYELYSTFFKGYTQKVWGVPCNEIKPEWGKQRIKGLSITKTILNAIKPKKSDLLEKNQETSLINEFMYPKLGPGFLWETVADIIKSKNGEIYLNEKVVGVNYFDKKINSVSVQNIKTGKIKEYSADYFISSMPVKDLIDSLGSAIPSEIKEISNGLQYRDFITVGLLLNKLKISTSNNPIKDNWIYIQEKDVKLGRIQIFNNWSPYMVKNSNQIWLGLEYFCNEGDELWNMLDDKFSEFAISELVKIGIIDEEDVLDNVVIRINKAYPAYFGSYDKFSAIKEFTDKFENLYLVGRNGMHRYNNMDHSMMTSIQAVKNIVNKTIIKDNIWEVNLEKIYHEENN